MRITYLLCKAKIDKKQYADKERMQEMLDVFYAGERLNTDEYQELTNTLTTK